MKYPTWYVVMRESDDRELEPMGGVYDTPEEATRAAIKLGNEDHDEVAPALRRRYVPYKCEPCVR